MKRIGSITLAMAALVALSLPSLGLGQGRATTSRAARTNSTLPFTFFMTHYVLLGDPTNPSGVRYESTGHPFAMAPDGSTFTISGRGAWDPPTKRVRGGGDYTITDPSGGLVRSGRWHATRFVNFLQIPGWWGIPGFEESGWQGPPGSSSFSGFLRIRVRLDDGRTGLLTAWCIMPTSPHVGGHVSDGVMITGRDLDFTDSRATEQSLEGMMFYSPGTGDNDD